MHVHVYAISEREEGRVERIKRGDRVNERGERNKPMTWMAVGLGWPRAAARAASGHRSATG